MSSTDPCFTSSCHHLARCVALKERGDKVLDAGGRGRLHLRVCSGQQASKVKVESKSTLCV